MRSSPAGAVSGLGSPSRTGGLLAKLLPKGGKVVLMVEGYFDESGSFDEKPGIFCISGYFIDAASAGLMDVQWGRVLEQHQLPYFHMVDCAHGTGPFAGKTKAERTEIVTKFISLIKNHTLEGFSALASRDHFVAEAGEGDIYTVCATLAVDALRSFLETHRIEGDTAYFFEAGHSSSGRAYNHLARRIAEFATSITFARKSDVKLLQAADLLAWQASKYAKDKYGGTRPPRKDFLSLMEHRHTLFWLSRKDDEKVMGIEIWPLADRHAASVNLRIANDGPLPMLYRDGEDVPMLPISKAIGWRMGGANLVDVGFETLAEKSFYLTFEQRRLHETILALVATTQAYASSGVFPIVKSTGISARRADTGEIILRVQLDTGGALGFRLSREAIDAMLQDIDD